MENHKECGIWLDDGAMMSELKIKKGSTITWETAYSADIDKAREVATDKMQAMSFIHKSSRRYDGLRSEMEKNMSKGRDAYPTEVTSAYNLMLEWQPGPGLMQGGLLQRENHLEFAQHNEKDEGKITAKIYKHITCYKCSQHGHYSGSRPFKEDKQ